MALCQERGFIGAGILRAQWLSMRFGTRGRAIAVLVGTIWYGMGDGGTFAIAAADAANLRIYLPLGPSAYFSIGS